MTQHYELMFIIPGSLDEVQVPTVKERVNKLVEEAGGKVTVQYDMQRRRLAYKIKQQTFGYYHLMQFDIEPAQINDLEKKILLDQEILRHLLVKAVPKTEQELEEMLAFKKPVTKEEEVVETIEPTKKVEAKPVPTPIATTPTEEPAPAAPTEEKALSQEEADALEEAKTEDVKEKVSMEELDKKLDAILDDSDLDLKL